MSELCPFFNQEVQYIDIHALRVGLLQFFFVGLLLKLSVNGSTHTAKVAMGAPTFPDVSIFTQEALMVSASRQSLNCWL